MQPWLFLLYLFIASDMIASGVSGYTLWRRRNGGVAALAIVFSAMFFRGMCEMLANACGYESRPVHTLGFAWFYWIGRAVWTGASWWFVVYLLGRVVKNQDHG